MSQHDIDGIRRAFCTLVVLISALVLRAGASATLLLEEPYGKLGFFSPTGHVAVYLSGVCADSPLVLRGCAQGETGIVLTGCLKKKSAMAAGVGLRRRARLGLPSTLSPFRGLRSGREKCRPLDRGCSRPARRCRHALPISGSAGSRGSWGSRNAVRDVGHLDHA